MNRLAGTDPPRGPDRAGQGPAAPAGPPAAADGPVVMSGEPLRRTVTLTNPLGLHMRPMSAFVQLAGKFQCCVFVVGRDNKRVDGKSMFGLMALAAEQGTELTIEAVGPDQQDALDALAGLLANLSDDEGVPAEEPPR
jgi:phosphocarrier protein HPr